MAATLERDPLVSTHSRLKAAGVDHSSLRRMPRVSTHSRLKAAGHVVVGIRGFVGKFQHTAA